MTTDLDPATSLPALPKGLFWRIAAGRVTTRRYIYTGHPVLELRERRRFSRSKRVASAYFYGRSDWVRMSAYRDTIHDYMVSDDPENSLVVRNAAHLSSEQIVIHAELLLEEYNKSQAELARAREFIGDYPPRKLA